MKPWYQRNKGFTFIEVILSLCIIAVIIISFYSLMEFSNKACIRGEKKDELLLNGRYAIEYIKNEIKSADKIISSDKIEGLYVKFPSNIGFVILQINEDVDPNIYNYVTYHVNGNKIVRVACNRMDDNYPRYSYFSGNNNICEYICPKSQFFNAVIFKEKI